MTAVRVFDTPLGRMAVAATARGVVRVALPGCRDDVAAVARSMTTRVPRFACQTVRQAATTDCEQSVAPESPDRAEAEAIARQAERELAEYLAGTRRTFAVPVDLGAAPPFHRTVYKALRSVPFGRTVTYAALARRAGSPRAARAVGQAMAHNPVPLVVPCHRVVASAGPGGFGGGLALKRRLLALEGVAV